jgi:hypothetical protein
VLELRRELGRQAVERSCDVASRVQTPRRPARVLDIAWQRPGLSPRA